MLKAYLQAQGRQTQEEEEEEELWRRSSPAYNVEELEELGSQNGGLDLSHPANPSNRTFRAGRNGVIGRLKQVGNLLVCLCLHFLTY